MKFDDQLAANILQADAARVVMEVLGHSSIGLTADTYSHVMPSLVEDASEKVAGVLFTS
jgi:integrase